MRLRTAAFLMGSALGLAVVPAAAHAFGHLGGQPGREAGHIQHMAKALGLTESQTTQVEAIVAKHEAGPSGEARQSMRDAKGALAATIHDDAATDDQVRDAAAAVAALETQLAVARHRMVIEIAGILTPDQRAKLAELKSQFREHHSHVHADAPGGF